MESFCSGGNKNVTVFFVKQLMEFCVPEMVKDYRQRLLISESVDAVMDFPPWRNAGIWHYQNAWASYAERWSGMSRRTGLSFILSQWANGQAHGWVLIMLKHTFNIQHVNNFGIDGTEFLDDPMVCAPITFYLLYRITQLLDGRRLVIFLDEFWKWLQDGSIQRFCL